MDLFESTKILCEDCNKATIKTTILKNGFKLRALECPNCHKRWYHPLDLKEYEEFSKIKSKDFQVKLRLVGNSWAVSIPKEIIEFQKEMERNMNKMIHMSLEQPGKLSIFFKVEKLIKKQGH